MQSSRYLLFTTLACVIGGSLAPGPVADRIPLAALHLNDKGAHLLGYAILALLAVFAFPYGWEGLLWAAAGVPLGIALEFAQRLVPGRTFEPADMLANTVGVLAGGVLGAGIRWGYGWLQ